MLRVHGWASATFPRRAAKPAIIPLPAAVMQQPDRYVAQYPTEVEDIKSDPPLFWSTVGPRRQGLVTPPIEGKNIWRLLKTYGRLIGYPTTTQPRVFPPQVRLLYTI